MKRIFLVILAFAFYIIANAQIPKKVWNLTLGVSDEKQVINALNAHNLKDYKNIGSDITCNTSFDFGGEKWNYAKFSFYQNKLYSISFRNSSSFSLKETFERLKNSLDNNYSDFIIKEDLHNDLCWYIVYKIRRTTIKLSYFLFLDSVEIEYYNEWLKSEKETHTR